MINNPSQSGQPAGPQPPAQNQQVEPTLFPATTYASVPVDPDKLPTEIYTRSLSLTDNQERELLRKCNTFKINTLNHAKERKINQERNYAYFTNNFFDGTDLLPTPSTIGDDRDSSNGRPQVFIPVTREQLLQIYAMIAIRMFPNDEDYFRVVAKKEEYAVYEDGLTDALKYLFKKDKIPDQIKRCLMNGLWSGHFAAFPTFQLNKGYQWISPSGDPNDPNGQDYQLQPTDLEPTLLVNEINPIHLYLDPITCPNPRWMILGFRKMQEALDSPFTIEAKKPKIYAAGGQTQPLTSQYLEGLPIAEYNDLNTNFIDYEKWQQTDTFYFPFIELDGQPFYNVSCVMIEQRIISEFRPNVAFTKSQLVQEPLNYQTESNYGWGPADDMQGMQRIVNILYNYLLESISRNGNIWGIMEGTDISNLFGAVARIAMTPPGIPPNEAIMPIQASHEELEVIQNMLGVLKAEMVNAGGSQDPFQGSSNIDFKKTATEVNLLQANSGTRNQEMVEHIGYAVSQTLERLAFMAAHLYQGPITVRIDDPKAAPIIPGQQPGPQDIQAAQAQQAQMQGQPVQSPQGPFFRQIDLSVLRTGEFVIELTGVNAAQSKAAESQLFMELIQLCSSNPQGAIMAEAIIQKIASLNGVKDFAEVFDSFKARFEQMQAMQAAQAQLQAAQKQAATQQQHQVSNNAVSSPVPQNPV